MRIHVVMLVVLLITGDFIDYVHCTFIKSRTWHEEFAAYREAQHKKILYPRYKVCRAPREKPEKIKPKSVQSNIKTAEVSWAELLTIYTADSGAEIYNWDIWKKTIDPNKSTRWGQLGSIFKFYALIVLIFCLFVFLVPTIGKCGFKFYSLIWFVIFHPEMRRICRRIFIMKEKISRKHMKLLLPKAGDRAQQQKRKQFRLPFVLREYNEEEVPAELVLSGDDDSDEVSSDGFENLLIRSKNRGAGGESKSAKNLVHLMASTEQELEATESDSEMSTLANPEAKRGSFLRHLHNRPSKT